MPILAELTAAMNEEESRLLAERQSIADRHFETVIFVVAVVSVWSILDYTWMLHRARAR